MSELKHYREHEIALAELTTNQCTGLNRGGSKLWMRLAISTFDEIPQSRRPSCVMLLTYIMEWMRPRPGQETLYPARYSGQRLVLNGGTVMRELDLSSTTYRRVVWDLEKIRAIITEPHPMGFMITLDIEGYTELLALGLTETTLSKQEYFRDRDKYEETFAIVRNKYADVTDAIKRLSVANGG